MVSKFLHFAEKALIFQPESRRQVARAMNTDPQHISSKPNIFVPWLSAVAATVVAVFFLSILANDESHCLTASGPYDSTLSLQGPTPDLPLGASLGRAAQPDHEQPSCPGAACFCHQPRTPSEGDLVFDTSRIGHSVAWNPSFPVLSVSQDISHVPKPLV